VAAAASGANPGTAVRALNSTVATGSTKSSQAVTANSTADRRAGPRVTNGAAIDNSARITNTGPWMRVPDS
jgi:hypothetical protein